MKTLTKKESLMYRAVLKSIPNKNKFQRIDIIKELLDKLEIDYSYTNRGIHIFFGYKETTINIWSTTMKLETIYYGNHVLFETVDRVVDVLSDLDGTLKVCYPLKFIRPQE